MRLFFSFLYKCTPLLWVLSEFSLHAECKTFFLRKRFRQKIQKKGGKKTITLIIINLREKEKNGKKEKQKGKKNLATLPFHT